MGDPIIVELQRKGFEGLVKDVESSAEAMVKLGNAMDLAQKKLDTLDKNSAEFKKLSTEIDATKAAMGAMVNSSEKLTGALQKTRNEMGDIQRAMDAVVASGGKNSEVYKDLQKQLEETGIKGEKLKDQIKAINAQFSDTKGLDTFIRGLGLGVDVIGVFSAAQVLLGGKNKALEETLVKLNAVMLISNSLQRISAELSRQDSVVKVAAAKATQLYNLVVGESVGVMKLLKIAFASTGIGLLILAIPALIEGFKDLISSGGFLGKVLGGISDVISKSIQGYKDLADAIGLTNFAGKKLAEEEKQRQEQALKDLERNAKLDIDIRKAHHQDVLLQELALLETQSKAAEEEKRAAKIRGDEKLKDFEEEADRLADAIRIKQAEIEQKVVDDKKKADDKSAKEKEEADKKRTDDALKAKEAEFKRELELATKLYNSQIQLKKDQQEFIDKLEEERLAKAKHVQDLIDAEFKRQQNLREDEIAADKAQADLTKSITEQAIADLDALAAKKKEAIDKMGDIAQTALGIAQEIQSFASGISDIALGFSQRNANAEIAVLEDKRKRGVISEKQYQKELNKIRNEQAKKEHDAQVAQAAIQVPIAALQGFIAGLSQGGLIAAAIFAAIATAFAVAQVALIASSPVPKFRGGGQVSEKLGLIKGKPHEAGGVPIEVEGDEYVMPVKQTKENLKALKAIHEGKFNQLFIPANLAFNADLFSKIPNAANIPHPVTNNVTDNSAIENKLKMIHDELYYLNHYTRVGNTDRKEQTDKVVSKLEVKRKYYV